MISMEILSGNKLYVTLQALKNPYSTNHDLYLLDVDTVTLSMRLPITFNLITSWCLFYIYYWLPSYIRPA